MPTVVITRVIAYYTNVLVLNNSTTGSFCHKLISKILILRKTMHVEVTFRNTASVGPDKKRKVCFGNFSGFKLAESCHVNYITRCHSTDMTSYDGFILHGKMY